MQSKCVKKSPEGFMQLPTLYGFHTFELVLLLPLEAAGNSADLWSDKVAHRTQSL